MVPCLKNQLLTLHVAGAVMPGTKLQEHSGSEKAWVYSTVDFADEEQKPELFCFRFSSVESTALSSCPVLADMEYRAYLVGAE